ncbi:hypothetical protein ABPG74_021897 [Tetrahymena malaccensis]
MDINFQNSIQFNDQEKIVESIQGENLQNFDKKDIQNKQNLIENQQQISQEKRYDYYQIPKKNQIDMFKDNENDQRYLITKIQSQESSKQRNKKVIQKSDSKIPEQNYSKKSCQFIEQGDLSSNSSDKNNDQDEIYINQEKLQLISQKGELINKGGQGFVYTVKNDQNQVLKISPYSYPDIQRQHQIIKKIQKGKRFNPYKIHTPFYTPQEQKQKNAFLKIELLTKKKNPDYIKKALDIIQGLSNKNLKKLLKSLEAQEIFKNQTYRSLDFFLLEKSLNGLSDQDFFEFYIKIYEKKENQDKKQEASCEIKTIEELKYLMENHKYITINLSEKAQKENILTEMRNSFENDIQDEGVKSIFQGLQEHLHITNLKLGFNANNIKVILPQSMKDFLKNLKAFLTNFELRLEKNQFEYEAAEQLVEDKTISQIKAYFQKLIYNPTYLSSSW